MSRAKVAGIAVAVAVVVALVFWWRSQNRRDAADEATYEERLRVLTVERDSLARQARTRDTVYEKDTASLGTLERRYRLSAAEARRLAGLLTQPRGRDTVPVTVTDSAALVAAMHALALGDSTIRACRAALSTCEQRIADRDAQIANERRLRATGDSLAAVLLRRARPRLLPYLEAGVDPLHTWGLVARGGLEVRAFGPVRLTAALQYSAAPSSTTSALIGARITF